MSLIVSFALRGSALRESSCDVLTFSEPTSVGLSFDETSLSARKLAHDGLEREFKRFSEPGVWFGCELMSGAA